MNMEGYSKCIGSETMRELLDLEDVKCKKEVVDYDDLAPLNWRDVALMMEWKKTSDEWDKEFRELMDRLAANFTKLALKSQHRMLINLSRNLSLLSASGSEVGSSSGSEGTVPTEIQSGASQDTGIGERGKILQKRCRFRCRRKRYAFIRLDNKTRGTEVDEDYDELNDIDVYQQYFRKKTV